MGLEFPLWIFVFIEDLFLLAVNMSTLFFLGTLSFPLLFQLNYGTGFEPFPSRIGWGYFSRALEATCSDLRHFHSDALIDVEASSPIFTNSSFLSANQI
jgi:hypothetical protein